MIFWDAWSIGAESGLFQAFCWAWRHSRSWYGCLPWSGLVAHSWTSSWWQELSVKVGYYQDI